MVANTSSKAVSMERQKIVVITVVVAFRKLALLQIIFCLLVS